MLTCPFCGSKNTTRFQLDSELASELRECLELLSVIAKIEFDYAKFDYANINRKKRALLERAMNIVGSSK
jgi:hypothetical protein